MDFFRHRLLGIAALASMAVAAMAQSGTNSPYSQYGLGVLADQSQGFNRGMAGLALGFRNSNQVNTLNPASYSAVDSLTLLFDMGFSLQNTNFQQGATKRNAKNGGFEYAVAAFRLARHVGFSFGILPYSNIGYQFYQSGTVRNALSEYSVTETYQAEPGGVHEVYVGSGWSPLKGLSVGANVGYLWGNYDKWAVSSYSNTAISSLSKVYSANISSYKLDLGLQYTLGIGKADALTLGVTYGLGHKLGTDVKASIIKTNAQTSVADTLTHTVKNGLALPTTWGVGLSYSRAGKWSVGADYTLQKWGSVDYPAMTDNNATYRLVSGMLRDRHKVTVGGEWVPDVFSRFFLSRIHYRIGASYTTPYVRVHNAAGALTDGPSELCISAGFGIPVINTYNNRSLLNISGQWVRASAGNGLIKENYLRLNIGITFNERWFMKWKVE